MTCDGIAQKQPVQCLFDVPLVDRFRNLHMTLPWTVAVRRRRRGQWLQRTAFGVLDWRPLNRGGSISMLPTYRRRQTGSCTRWGPVIIVFLGECSISWRAPCVDLMSKVTGRHSIAVPDNHGYLHGVNPLLVCVESVHFGEGFGRVQYVRVEIFHRTLRIHSCSPNVL